MSNGSDDARRIANKFRNFFKDIESDIKLCGENARTAIVQTTLGGIGANDEPFAPYSIRYQEVIDAVGGKPRQNVDLRGLFYHEGQKQKKYRSEKSRQKERAGRQAYIEVAFGGVGFTAKTGITRPQLGITDTLSEMSDDLIEVKVLARGRLRLVYRPRKEGYMIAHNEGEGKLPKREWFTFRKTMVVSALLDTFAHCIRARVVYFNARENP